MDDGFALWPKNANIDAFREILHELHPSLEFTVDKEKKVVNKTLIHLYKFKTF